MTKARDIASATTPNANAALLATFPHRNLIINGAMQVAQRGTSQTATGYGSIDRMGLSLSGATATMTQETLTLGQTDIPAQFRNYLRVATTTGDNYCGIYQRIENVDTVEGQVTVSFYAKGTNPSGGSFAVFLYQGFGTGGSTGVLTSEQSFTTTSSWQRFEFVFTLPSLSGKTIGTGSHIEINICQPVGDTGTGAWTLDITGVQLEVGDTATPFEHRSYGDELARCQRYFQSAQDSLWGWTFQGFTDRLMSVVPSIVPMRALPTFSCSGLIKIDLPGVANATQSSFAISTGTTTSGQNAHIVEFLNFSGLTTSVNYRIRSDSGVLFMDAEL